MKTVLSIIFIFISAVLNAQTFVTIDTTKHIFYYDYTFIEDINDYSNRQSHMMVLEIGHNSSKFYSINKAIRDSILTTLPPEMILGSIMSISSDYPIPQICDYYVFKQKTNMDRVTYISNDRNASNYLVSEDVPLSWTMSNENDTTIFGYKCRKATTSYAGRDYIAWFTLDIPINDGPYKFHGLPGLIVSLYDTSHEHEFVLAGTNSTAQYPIYKPERKYIKTTTKGFQKGYHAGNEEVIKTLETLSDESAKARAIAFVRSERMNFIERY